MTLYTDNELVSIPGTKANCTVEQEPYQNLHNNKARRNESF